MSAEFTDSALAQIRDVTTRLQNPVPDHTTLLQLLCAPLACIGLLPPRFRQYNVSPLPTNTFSIHRHIPALQRTLLEHVIRAWEPVLVQEDSYSLLEQYFCPDSLFFTSAAAGQIAVHAYSTILALPLTDYSIRFLARLSKAYPLDVLHSVVFSDHSKDSSARKTVTWEDCVRNVAAIPAKVANVTGGKADSPPELEQGAYFNGVSERCELLVAKLSTNPSRENITSVAYLLGKLVNIGMFSPSRPNSPSQPSFFQTTLPTIRARLSSSESSSYSEFWSKVLYSLPSSLVLQSILISLFSSMAEIPSALDSSMQTRSLVKREARLLKDLLGALKEDNQELLDSWSAVALGREWSEGHARIFVCWAAGAETDQTDVKALEILFTKVTDMWTTPDHIRHSFLSRHHYLTSLFLIAVCSFRGSKGGTLSPVHALALSPPFISAVSTYISHLDPSVRRCGMLVAEEVARAAGKKLDFGDWEGDQHGRSWCRQIRELVKERDVDADVAVAVGISEPGILENQQPATDIPFKTHPEVKRPARPTVRDVEYDSDDSLTGYASPSSSRSPSPDPSELEEIENDPTLRVGHKKVVQPVYLAQLGEMVRNTSGLKAEQEDMEPQNVEVALNVADELIRRKRAYGTELEENAVNLSYGFIGLKDNYDLERFEEKRRAALNALVSCCPRKAAPAMIEEFFRNQYSVDQRYAILNALALGARELAGLPVIASSAIQPLSMDRVSFPSKRLPSALHKKYLTSGDEDSANNTVQQLLEDISREALENGKDSAAEKVPELVRERQLRIRKPAKITEVPRANGAALSRQPQQVLTRPQTTFTDVAAEYFICPLINRFWLFLRDEQAHEARTAHQPALHRYSSAGTGLILNAVILARFLGALAVLVHAARNAPEWLAVIAPDALELAVTLGTRPLSFSEGENEDDDSQAQSGEPGQRTGTKGRSKEAAVLTTALELALVVLDGCLDLDGGRSIGLEHTSLLLGTGEWAADVFAKLEKGAKMLGGGGIQKVGLRRAAAGVVLKVDELTTKWRRSMIDMVQP
ncbi:telomeric DNA binding protein [Amylocystis lapponica]|nr:telomeric DNA binding protein [Amylocystis lapponica]